MRLLDIEQVTVKYGPVSAVESVSLVVCAGEIVALVGSNGAGKSSLLKAVIGLVAPQSGRITIDEAFRIEGRKSHWITRRYGLAYVAEDRNIFARMSVRENVLLGLYARRRQNRTWLKESLDFVYEVFPKLAERAEQTAGTLSGGEQQMVVMARALVSRPKMLLLDEPSLGLAPIIVESIFERLATIRASGTGILLVEQNSKIAFEVSDRGYVMENGHVVFEGKSAELARNPRVREAYLGLGAGR